MKKHVLTLIGLFVLFAVMSVTVVFAQYIYRASYTISENGTASYDMLPVWEASNNQWMIDNGFIIDVDALDTRVETLGGLVRPHMMTDNMTLTAVAVPTGSQTNLYFTTGNSLLSAFDIIVGRDGYITTADNITIELGDNWTFEWSGWVPATSINSSIVEKLGAFRAYVSDSGNMTFSIIGGGAAGSVNLTPNAEGDYTNIDVVTGAATHWEAVDDPPGASDNDTTYVSTDSVSTQWDTYELTDASLPANTVINTVTVFYRFRTFNVAGWARATPRLQLEANSTNGTQESTLSTTYIDKTEALTRPGGGTWTVSDIDNLQVGIGLLNTAAFVRCTQVYVTVDYNLPVEVTATGTTADRHAISASSNVTHLSISIDGSVEDTTTPSANVTNNTNDLVFMQDIPYSDNISISVNGTQALLYEPITYIRGDNIPDRGAGVSNNGTITWGTNPTGLTVSLGSMVSSSQPAPGQAISDPAQDILPGVEVTDWFLPPDISGALLTNPMRPFVTLLSDTTTLTEIQSWRLLALAFVLLVTLSTARGVRGHHLITGIACGASWGGMVALTIFPMWSLVFMILPIVAGLIAERSPSL